MHIEGQFDVAAPPAALMVHLLDTSLMASCLPGCESLERVGDDSYRATLAFAMAGITARFELVVDITKKDALNIWSVTRGEEGGRASALQADSVVTLTPTATGSQVAYRSEVNVTGRLGRFALGMMKKKAQSMGDEFAANLQRRLEELQRQSSGAPVAAPAASPLAPVSQMGWWQRLWSGITGAKMASEPHSPSVAAPPQGVDSVSVKSVPVHTTSTLLKPRTLAEAVDLLSLYPDAKPLSGGATLVAMINARVIEPTRLVSLANIPEIKGISALPDGRLRIGAFTRHRETADSELTTGQRRVVSHAASQIANATVRNMGTIGGSIAFADPGLDYPPALVAVGAEVLVAGSAGERSVAAKDFFVDWYTTALKPGEMVVGVVLPADAGGHGLYLKHARVVGDYATVSVAICANAQGQWRVAVGGCGPTPLSDDQVNTLLSAGRDAGSVAQAGALLQALADPLSDVRGSAEYRRLLIPRMLASAVRQLQQEKGAQ